MIITDSGGIQEEASVMGKKILILREETERPEVLENKSAILAGTDHQKLSDTDIFGGDATNKTVNAFSNFLLVVLLNKLIRIYRYYLLTIEIL
ncbi:MAG: UDP-N-acetylglucosamine 2-epimerase [Saprospiraceae bacterium]|nr:UDP-N-acetylglucosamine 2-epimerase [Saprospiraceae bacterium]